MRIQKVTYLILISFLLVISSCKEDKKVVDSTDEQLKPNIIIIYADDLGYGEMGAYGATELKTPNLDKLANGGMRFTNGFASSATCTPSRYALMTGVYPWRNKNAKILPGTAPLIIDTAQPTIPKMLKKQGYYTGIVGKWHLGLGSGNVNWNERIAPGPNEVGFDYSHILAATQDRVPTVYIENGKVVNLDPNDPIEVSYEKNFDGEPTGLDNPELLKMKWHHGHNNSIVNGIPRIGFMKGGEAAKWVDEDMADYFLADAQAYVKKHKSEPFFLYYALQQPHVPRTPNARFVGSSGMGPRGDVIVEADWMIGEFVKTLEAEGLLENTLIIFSSDNGPVVNDGYYDDSEEKLGNHTPAGILRGGKYSLFEAGTRVPFFTYWKGKINPGVSDAMVSQIDLFTSLASLVGSDESTTDSQELLDAFLGKNDVGRSELVVEATSRTAFRKGDWAMIPPYNGPAINKYVNIELGNDKEYQLYNLKEDIEQQKNLAQSNPDKLQEMITSYEKIRGVGDEKIAPLELK
ncbi:arylsulfatase [Aurantibacter crassamenti]|uniref:sulfatase family protein n=1 Tax=Aurantibacter crassamenti TaxID=1837375 RepID=UPI00193A7AA7|nr:arylsulfatase [Aurantibacter crassamenti]MBM1107703.1 arylsulfatase [Aurantibacter crassamenti]